MSSQQSPLTILHVDDDPSLTSLVKTFLERDASPLECSVQTETDPADALDRIRAESFDVVISDYNMPELNGIELLTAIREEYPELPVLLFSGEETEDIAAEIIATGVTDYLRKGFSTDQYTMLVRRVEHAVDSGEGFDPEQETELDGIGVVGLDERFEQADTAYASLYDYDPEDVEGKHWTELHPEEEVEHIRENVLPVVESGGKWTGRSTGLRADGSTFTESKMVTAMDDGRLLIAVDEATD
jgi:PAS domain S-box-containing protein